MPIHPQKKAWRLLTGLAVLILAPIKPVIGSQPTTPPPSDTTSAAPDDQATPDPDCAQADSAATDDDQHLIDDPYGQAFTGARNGKVKLVMFIDYGCPACRLAQPLLDRLVAEDPNLEVIYRIVDNEEGSTGVSEVSLEVARSKGDWQAFHHVLDAGTSVTDDAIGKALDAVHLKKSCYLPTDSANISVSVSDEMRLSRQFLYERKLKNFPSWVIGRGSVHDDMDYALIKAAIAKAEAHGS